MKPVFEAQGSNPVLTWKLRISRRARYARLQIRPYGGLEVVIPPRFPRGEVALLVERHADWARRQLAEQARLRESIRLPDVIHLPFDDSLTPLAYRFGEPGVTGDLFAMQDTDALCIDAGDYTGQIGQIRQWLRRRAVTQLPPLLEQLASQTGLAYSRVSIRSQKTRWGSCSLRGTISLNDQCLFLPRQTVEYLMIHELCHTRHLNHSQRFWKLVARHCPEYRAQEEMLSRPRELVPDWFLLDLYR